MKAIETTRLIDAPLEVVFRAISDPRQFSEAVPDIRNVEFLSESHTGAGTRFRETREMKGRLQTVELEVAEHVENEHVRMISDAGGTIWDSVFSVRQEDDAVVMTLVMDARPYQFLARLITPLIRGLVAKAVEQDMDAVKTWCEQSATQRDAAQSVAEL